MISLGSVVTLHFSLALTDGSVIDSNFDKAPATFTVGDGSLLPGFETALLGLRPGDHHVVEISPQHAFGEGHPGNVQRLKRNQFPSDLPLQKGLVVSFADAAKGEMPGVIVATNSEQVTVDFNHPLAGKPIVFSVEIVAVAAKLPGDPQQRGVN